MSETIISFKNNPGLMDIKSDYILKYIFNSLKIDNLLKIINYNKKLQKRTNKDIDDYKKEYIKQYLQIIIEIIPIAYTKSKIININKTNESYYHIYFNDNKNEIKRKIMHKSETISKIKIIIDYEIKTLSKLFQNIRCIKKINFIRFNRKDIIDMSYMFDNCKSLEEIDVSKLITDNVKDMSNIFYRCSSLKKLNLSNFNTDNVIDMSYMFDGCSSLEKINLSNFNTSNVQDMSGMFSECSSLKELNLSNFNTDNVTNMSHIFNDCLNLDNLICTDKFIIKHYKNKY